MPDPYRTLLETEYRDVMEKLKDQFRKWILDIEQGYPDDTACLLRIQNEMESVYRDL